MTVAWYRDLTIRTLHICGRIVSVVHRPDMSVVFSVWQSYVCAQRAPRCASVPRCALSFGFTSFRVLVIVANATCHLGALKVFRLLSCLALGYSTSGSKLRVSVASLLGPEV